MTRTRRASFAYGLAGLLLAGVNACAPVVRSAAPSSNAALLPLGAGNEWVYEVRDAAGRVSSMTMRVRGGRYLRSRGMEATIVEESGGIPGNPSFDDSTDLVAYYHRGGFVFRSSWVVPRGVTDPAEDDLEDRGAELGDEQLLPLDPEHDSTWQGRYALFDQFETSSRLSRATETVAVPAGRFRSCVRVETHVAARAADDPEGRTILHDYVDWYAPGVGLVKSESFVAEGDSKLAVGTAELARFHVGDRR